MLQAAESGRTLTPITSRNDSDGGRPGPNKNIGNGGVIGGWGTAVVLEDVKPVIRGHEFWAQKEAG